MTKANVAGVKEVFAHAHYTPSTVGNDIALLRTAEDFKFDDYVSPICLEKNTTFEDDQIFVGAGWGNIFQYTKVDAGSNTAIESLDDISRISTDVVEERMMQLREFSENQTEVDCVYKICVGGINSGGLPGDSGGPLMLLKDRRWIKVGIASAIYGMQTMPNNRLDLLELSEVP